ncbi:MAG: hypothetical protein HC790_03440 [Acaryochloridaceae cyanobacterium CSU_3_4]|nr:hypothetical protein [Acaryochloridaceae cyanobacterium CSU_3_4]
MRKGSELMGKLVVAYDTGEAIAKVLDLIFDQDSNQLAGILVDEGNWFSGAWVVAMDQISAIGPNALIVKHTDAIVKARKTPHIQQILKREIVLKGTRIMTTDGADLGIMVDLFFDDKTGIVKGYEVSGGLFADVYSGRSFVPAPKTFKIGVDFAFVPPEVAQLMAEQVGGIKGVVQTAGDRLQATTGLVARQLQEIAQTVSDRLQETAVYTNQRLQAVINQAVSAAMNTIVDPAEQKQFVIGRTVDRDVTAPDGTLLIGAGQLVTDAIAERAEQNALLDQLYKAVGGSFAAELNRRVQETTAATQQQLQEVLNQAVSSMMNTIVDPAEQKAFIVGKTVDKEISAPDGTLLIRQGAVVTDAIAERAEQNALLDQLYKAVGGSFAAELNRRVQETTTSTNQRLQDVINQSVTSMMNSIVNPTEQKAFMVGKTVDRDVTTPNGVVLIRAGELVTPSITEAAEAQTLLDQLYKAVGGSFAAELSHQIEKATGSSNQRLQEIMNQAISAMTNNMIDPEEQKAFVLGKTVAQDLIAPDGSVIVAQGVAVTASMAETAEDQAMLDQLYKAVGGSFPAELSRKASDILAKRIVNQTLGRRATQEVRTTDGVIIAAVGQIVTQSVIVEAQNHAKEQALLEATGLSMRTALRGQGNTLLSGVGAPLRSGTAQVGAGAANLWHVLQVKASDLQFQSANYIEARRIHRALGRPVTRVILDEADNVILDLGELITHEAIQRTRQAGVLDILLSSVYVKSPELSSETLHAPVPSLASLQSIAQSAVG